MTKRLLGVLLLAGCLALALPGIALAKLPTPKITGLKHVYVVQKGANLTIAGRIKGNASTKHWDQHVPLEIEMLVKGKWVDLIDAFEPKASGKFSVKLRKPSKGTYRVIYDGCEHYSRALTKFTVKGGSAVKPPPVVKLDPKLTVDAPWPVHSMAAASLKPMLTVQTMPLAAAIHTGLSPEAMNGTHLTLTALARIAGETSYTVVWTGTATGFDGSADITVSPIPVPQQDGDGHWYEYFKVRAEWLGNEYTNPGSADSPDFDWGD